MAPWVQETASAAEKYYIGDAILKPAVHHESFQKLWETKWKVPVSHASLQLLGVTYKSVVHYGSVPLHVWQCEGL